MSLSKVKSALIKIRPLFFNSVAYGSFYTGAEFLQQTYNNNQKEKAVSKNKYLIFLYTVRVIVKIKKIFF